MFFRKSSVEPLPVTMTAVGRGDRVLQVGVDDPTMVTALAAKESARQGQGKTVDFDPDWFNIDSDATLEGEKPNLKRYDS